MTLPSRAHLLPVLGAIMIVAVSACGGATDAAPNVPSPDGPGDGDGEAPGTSLTDADAGSDDGAVDDGTMAETEDDPKGGEKEAAEDAPAKPKLTATNLSGQLSPDQVVRFVEDHYDAFAPCVDAVAKKNPTYKVNITTKVHIGPSGKANSVKVNKSSGADAAFDSCMIDGFKKIAFGPPDGGATATVTFPMTFTGEMK